MSIGGICTRTVATASERETVTEVARRMAELNVGSAVIVDTARRPVGIVTDRDIVLRCVATGHDGRSMPVGQVMTREVRTVDESLPIEQALRTMARTETGRLVVTGDDGELVGVMAVDELVEFLAKEAESIGRLLRRESPRLG